MSRLLLFALLIYIVLADESCIIQDKKESPDIRVIELDDSSKESSQSESSEEQIVALHISDRRRREAIEVVSQEKSNFCKNDDECGPGSVCLARLTCVKGKWRTKRAGSLKANATN